MKALIRLALASLAAAALVATGPTMLASAAPALHTERAAVTAGTGGLAVAISMTRGTHAVSGAMPMTSQSRAMLARSVHTSLAAGTPTANNPNAISVRVGKNNCGGFNGDWYLTVLDDINGLPDWGMVFYGTEWDNCDYYTPNTTVYTYIKWTAIGITNNTPLQPPASGDSVGINQTIGVGVVTPGPVYATACLKWNNGWGCGPSQLLK